LVVVAVVLGAFTVLFQPALQSSLPSLVHGPEDLHATNALIDATARIARAVGPGLAGALAARIALRHFFTLDAVSFAVSAGAFFSLGGRFAWPAAGGRHDAPRGIVREAAVALSYVRDTPPVAWAFAALFGVNLAWACAFAVGAPLFAARVLGEDVGAYGFLIAAYGVGNIASNLVLGSIPMRRPLRTIFVGKLVHGLGFVVLAAAPSLPVALAGAALSAVGGPMGSSR
jgi:hypothetical protein